MASLPPNKTTAAPPPTKERGKKEEEGREGREEGTARAHINDAPSLGEEAILVDLDLGVTLVEDADAAAHAQTDANARRASTVILWLVEDAHPEDVVKLTGLKREMDGEGVRNEVQVERLVRMARRLEGEREGQ